jgi:hypothetical protein
MPSLRDIRRATADRLAPYELLTTGVADGGVYSGVAADSNRRRLVTTDMDSLAASGRGPPTPGDAYKNEWVYLLSTPPQQRRIPEGGFVGFATALEAATGYTADDDTEVAYLDVERPFSGVVAAGTVAEIHAIPPLRGGKVSGLHAAINRALRVMLREDTVLVSGVTGQYRYDLAATLPWLVRPDQLVSAHYVETVAGLDSWAIPGASIRFDANGVLFTPNSTFTTGQSIPLRVLRPLSSWIKVAGTWGESVVGLVNETDESMGDLDAISLVAGFHAAEAQADACVAGSTEQMFWLAKARAFAARSPFLRDQAVRRPRTGTDWPDNIAPSGPYGGRWGPQFR